MPFDRTGYLKFNEAYIPVVVSADYLLPLRRSVDLYSTPNEYYTWSYSIAIFLDNMQNSEILGTIAGDNTVFCVVRGHQQAMSIIDKLNRIIRAD